MPLPHHLAPSRALLSLLLLAASPACREAPPEMPPLDEAARQRIAKLQRARLGMAEPEEFKAKAAREAQRAAELKAQQRELAEERVPLAPTLQPSLLASALAERFAHVNAGTMDSPVVGEAQVIRGLARVQCGDGLVYQILYSPSATSKEVYTMPPLSLHAFRLAPNTPMSYEDGRARVTVIAEEDSPKRFKGRIKVEVRRTADTWSPIMDARLDVTDPLPALPQLRYDAKKIPRGQLMAECMASGHFKLVTRDGRTLSGLVSGVDIEGQGAARVHIPLSSRDLLRLTVTPPQPHTTYEKPVGGALDDLTERGARPATVRLEAEHREELGDPKQYTSKNIGIPTTLRTRGGQVQLRLTPAPGLKPPPRGKPDTRHRVLDVLITDTRVLDLMKGNLAGMDIAELRITTTLIRPGDDVGALGEAPGWAR